MEHVHQIADALKLGELRLCNSSSPCWRSSGIIDPMKYLGMVTGLGLTVWLGCSGSDTVGAGAPTVGAGATSTAGTGGAGGAGGSGGLGGNGPLPEGCVQGDFSPFFGGLHSHTGYSDGEDVPPNTNTPATAFDYAFTTGKLDSLAVTDHANVWEPITPDQWVGCQNQAAAMYHSVDAGLFVPTCGYELILDPDGLNHANVLFPDPDAFDGDRAATTVSAFYQRMAGCTACVGQMNHTANVLGVEAFDAFAFDAEADQHTHLFELNNIQADEWGAALEAYVAALDHGWHLSPTWNQDNHHVDFGTLDDNRTGVFLVQLDPHFLHLALRQRRTFATRDKNAWIKLLADHVCWMGSVLTGITSTTLSIAAHDPDPGDTFSALMVYGSGGTLLHTTGCDGTSDCVAEIPLSVAPGSYLFAVATRDGSPLMISAPIWF
jgi:hypothetical protein